MTAKIARRLFVLFRLYMAVSRVSQDKIKVWFSAYKYDAYLRLTALNFPASCWKIWPKLKLILYIDILDS